VVYVRSCSLWQGVFPTVTSSSSSLDRTDTHVSRSRVGRIFMAQTVKPVQLNPSTVEAFEAYIREAEAGMEQTLQGNGPFLWCDVSSERTQWVRQGKIVAQRWSGKEPVKVPEECHLASTQPFSAVPLPDHGRRASAHVPDARSLRVRE